jgi:protein SCO1/2
MKLGVPWLGVLILVILAGLVSGVTFFRPYQFNGTVIDPPGLAPNFTLTDTKGQAFQLASQKGQIVLLFFGYTHCPDECPATLAVMKQVWAGLGNKTDRVKFDFITVDPERDTTSIIRAWLDKFNPDFIGLTGSMAQLQSVWKAYGVTVIKNNDGPDYSMTHSLNVYLVDEQGNLHVIYDYPFSQDALLKDLLHLLNS